MQWKKIAFLDPEDVLLEFRARKSGLSSTEVRERIEEYGFNRLPEVDDPWYGVITRRFRSSFPYLLLSAAALSYFLGDRLEAALIFLFVTINITLEGYQEYHSEKSLRLLRRYLVAHVRVRRSGEVVEIESEQIVPGDIVVVEVGNRLTADIRFLDTSGLLLDESIVSGESTPVAKTHQALRFPRSRKGMEEAENIGFAGTVVVSGRAEGLVIATGKDTSLSDVARLTEDPHEETVFERGLNHFSRFIIWLVAGTLSFIFLANIFLRQNGTNVLELLIFSLALAVSIVPSALPLITTVTLSRGSIRLAQKKVVVKRLSAIEDLGSIDVLCSDKTGTLTENALSVANVYAKDRSSCLRLASLSSVQSFISHTRSHNPFDLAVWHSLTKTDQAKVASMRQVDALPFDPTRRRNSILVEMDKKYLLVVRGAFEEIIDRCLGISKTERHRMIEWGKEAGMRGERILALATRVMTHRPENLVSLEKDLLFVGMISFLDPLKKSAKKTITHAKSLGIAVKILTGDSREVAAAVGRSVGLITNGDPVLTGAEFDALSPADQKSLTERCHVFARVSPEQKYRIIEVLKVKHEVGFLGEGINDAPALKLAHVGLVVQGAADIAREAADIVLLQRNLGSVVDGVREGRIIFANILKYLRITLTSNFGNFYSVALASLFLPFVPLLPIQILLLNLLSDFPMLSVATDNVDPEELERPRLYQIGPIILMTVFFGFVSSLFDFALFTLFYHSGASMLQTAWFLLSVITEVILIFSLRTRFPFLLARLPSVGLITLSLVAIVVAFGVVMTPIGVTIFQFTKETGQILLLVPLLSLLYFLATELVKRSVVQHFGGLQMTSKI